MGNTAIVKLMEHDQDALAHFSLAQVAEIFGHSLLLGIVLTATTYWMLTHIGGEVKTKKKLKFVLGSSNILFLCVGITALMILVNNNLARAFAIGACLSLVRFRVKLAQKSLSSNFLFGIIAGIACGLQMMNVAWIVTGAYVVIQMSLMFLLNWMSGGERPSLDEGEDHEK